MSLGSSGLPLSSLGSRPSRRSLSPQITSWLLSSELPPTLPLLLDDVAVATPMGAVIWGAAADVFPVRAEGKLVHVVVLSCEDERPGGGSMVGYGLNNWENKSDWVRPRFE